MSKPVKHNQNPASGLGIYVWMIVLAVIAIAIAGHEWRVRPGSPYISLAGDLLPIFFAIIAMAISIKAFRSKNSDAILMAIATIGLACLAVSIVVVDVLNFWVDPYSRGVMLGW